MINFILPNELIAQTPAHPRDSARLLVYDRATDKITDSVFSEVNSFLPSDSCLVVNNSKVENCRWIFEKAKIEIFVLEKLDQHTIRALVRPGRKFKLNQATQIQDWLSSECLDVDDGSGIRTLKLNVQHDDPKLKQFEHIPLPPYIKQNDTLANEYQTVYAKPLGSKAAPTAGLHFTPKLLADVSKSHTIAYITLHVGLGTFAKLTNEQLATGRLHAESYSIDKKTAETIAQAKHVTAVGTTSVRTLESVGFVREGHNRSLAGSTDILISPGYKFKVVGSMITNFHLPNTSLLLLVEALVGDQAKLQKIYDHAIKNKYRFYSFGDAMLIL